MPDDDFDRDLARRLGAYESRIPDADPPHLAAAGRRPPWAAFIGVGALTAVAVGVLALLLINAPAEEIGESRPTPSASTPTATITPTSSARASSTLEPTPPTTASPDVPAPPQTIAWDESAVPVHDGQIRRVVVEDGRIFALGSVGQDPAVWISVDGTSWERHDPPWHDRLARVSEPAGSGLNAEHLARIGNDFILIGTYARYGGDYREPAAWRSTDGETWKPIDDETLQAAFLVWDVTSGPAGLVAAAHGYPPGSGSAWLSADGESWTETTPDAGPIAIYAAVGTGSVYTLAGQVGSSVEGEQHPAIWRSSTGTDWEAIMPEGAELPGRIEHLSIGPDGWVALGVLDGRATAWRSTDGAAWSIASGFEPSAPDDEGFGPWRLASLRPGFVAVNGGHAFTLDPGPMATWLSEDGSVWREIATQPTLERGTPVLEPGIAVLGDLLIVVGTAVEPRADAPDLPDEIGWFSWVGSIER